jgi:hypothetical protein
MRKVISLRRRTEPDQVNQHERVTASSRVYIKTHLVIRIRRGKQAQSLRSGVIVATERRPSPGRAEPMANELTAFAKVAIYLKVPLVLAGFVVFVGFLSLRQLLNGGVIPVLQQGQGFKILRLVLSYGFVLGLIIILLGMGLKYRELSEQEQKRAASLIANELQADMTVVSELGKNTKTLSNVGRGLATISSRREVSYPFRTIPAPEHRCIRR